MLVAAYAAELLEGEVDALAATLAGLIRGTVPGYQGVTAVDDAELRSSCLHNLTVALRELAGDAGRPEPAESPQRRTGMLRARQGLPLESLLHSYRLGGRVLWQGLVRRAYAVGTAAEHRRLLEEAGAVWEVIDRHSTVVAEAYREEQERLRGRTLRRRAAILAALLDGRGVDAEVVREAAEVLDLPQRGPLLLAVTLDRGAVEPLRTPEQELRAAGFASSWITQARRESGLIPLPSDADAARVVAVLAGCAAGPVAVGPVVRRLDELGSARALADLVLRGLPEGYVGVARVEERLPEALLARSPEVAELLVEQTLGPVLALREPDRAALLATLDVLLGCGGSHRVAAERLFCHRNTVIKRVQRLERLTGRRLTDARDVVHLSLALAALRSPQEWAGAHRDPGRGCAE